jgi:TPR repeat protein
MKKYTLSVIIALFAFFMLTCCTSAASPSLHDAETNASIEKGLIDWFEGRTEKAEKIFNELVDSGTANPVPYQALAIIVIDRQRDYPKAARLYNRHRALAPNHTGEYRAILHLLDKYTDLGCVQAQLMRARLTEWGLAGSLDFSRGMLFLRRAADGGYAQAQRELGILYETGIGVEKNVRRAMGYYSAAALQNDAPAMKDLAVLLLRSAKKDRAQIDTALNLLRTAAEADFPDAQMIFAKIYDNGVSVKQDKKRALYWCEKAAQNGCAEAMYALGWLYENGRGVKKSDAEALKWYEEAAKNNDANALFRLGVFYYTSSSKKDHVKAYRFFKSAAEQGNITAWYNVAWMSRTGDGTKTDYEEARKWFTRSAMTGNKEAQYNLGVMYANGDGTEPDIEEAMFWFELARLSGNKDAQKNIDAITKSLSPAARDRAVRRAKTTFKRIAPGSHSDE